MVLWNGGCFVCVLLTTRNPSNLLQHTHACMYLLRLFESLHDIVKTLQEYKWKAKRNTKWRAKRRALWSLISVDANLPKVTPKLNESLIGL